MARMDAQTAADNAAIEDHRAKFGDAEAAKFATQVYILRQTQAAAPNNGYFAKFPRGIVILLAVWFALLETADKVPQLLLSLPKFEGDFAEYTAKPALVQAQLQKATEDAASAHTESCKTRYIDFTLIGTIVGENSPAFKRWHIDCADFEQAETQNVSTANDITARRPTSESLQSCVEMKKKYGVPSTTSEEKKMLVETCMGFERAIISTPATMKEVRACFEEVRTMFTIDAIADNDVQEACLYARFDRSDCFRHQPMEREPEKCVDLKDIITAYKR